MKPENKCLQSTDFLHEYYFFHMEIIVKFCSSFLNLNLYDSITSYFFCDGRSNFDTLCAIYISPCVLHLSVSRIEQISHYGVAGKSLFLLYMFRHFCCSFSVTSIIINLNLIEYLQNRTKSRRKEDHSMLLLSPLLKMFV